MTMRDREIREEELLAHLGWVQGLALRLVRDATGAEDVAQEAFVHALAQPVSSITPGFLRPESLERFGSTFAAARFVKVAAR